MSDLSRVHRWGLPALVVGALAQVVLPLPDLAGAIGYLIVAAAGIALAVIGLHVNSPDRPLGWALVIGGFAGWVAADLIWTVEQYGVGIETYPVPSDAAYLGSYALVITGLLVMLHTQRVFRRLSGVLDATIIATGSSIFVTAAVLLPLVDDSSLTVPGRLVSAAYPIFDVLLLVTAAQLWITPGARSRSYTFLLASLVAAFLPDITWTAVAFASGHTISSSITDAIWLLVYVLLAFAANDPSMRRLGQPNPGSESSVASRRRLALLAVGLMMPACALFVPRFGTFTDGVPIIGIAAFVLSALTLGRMASLLGVIQAQSVQLAALASSDSLTGAPNRRTWDHELSAACKQAKDTDTPLAIALIDLDRFKRYNDKYGHQAGDRLLREAVAKWSDVIGSQGMLARYGGEEFAILFPGMTVAEAAPIVHMLRAVMPNGQTFSAGISAWEPGTEPTVALAQADRSLYQAKRAGRDRIVAHPVDELAMPSDATEPRIVMQPIVDLDNGEVVAYEALARFGGISPKGAFKRAAEQGWGDVLEARAIVAALEVPGRPNVPLHLNASAAALRSQRFWQMIPEDLEGVVVEISEEYEPAELAELRQSTARLRSRGAKIAADDLGSGSHELLRLAAMRPDVVKLDRSLVDGCADDIGRQAVIRGALEFARSLGSSLCAEGARGQRDLEQLRILGVRYAQCFLLAEPSDAWGRAVIELPFGAPTVEPGIRTAP